MGVLLLVLAGLGMAAVPQQVAEAGAVPDRELLATEAGTGTEPVTRSWAEHQLESQHREAVTRLAREFGVAVPLAADIHEAALSEKIDPRLAFRLVRAESRFRPGAVSPVGALGLTQLMPATARHVRPGISARDLLEPETNLRVGFRYLRQLLDQYDGNRKLALTAYNRGPGTVDRLLSQGLDPDNGYAEKVLLGRSERHSAFMKAWAERVAAEAAAEAASELAASTADRAVSGGS